MDTSSGNPGPVSKRRRVGIACGPCRTRKSRCDGIRPKCSGCIELGYECIYTQTASMTNVIVGKEYLAGIEDRLKLVEQEISHMKNFRSNRHIRFDDATSSTGTALEGSPLTSFTDGVQVDSGNLQDNEVLESTTDGMGAMIFSQEEDIGFFGPSSNIAFTRQLSQVVTKLRNGNTGSDNSNLLSEAAHGVLSMSRPASPNAQATQYTAGAVNIYAVPSEEVTRDLVRHYFGTTGQLFPYLDEKLFWDTYDEMRQSNFTKVRRTWLGLFNMILALSTSTYLQENINAITRVQESDVYYQRALGLCQAQFLQNSSLEAVQFLLVTGQYLQGTQKSVQAWSIHGLAVKTAFQLGLHSGATLKKFSLLDQEIRKRTWYGCVVLDRTLSMTFGRPATIPDEYVRLPLPTPMQPQIDIEGTVMHTSTIFFVQTIVLYKIMWDVIKLLYAGNIGCDETLPPVDAVSGIFKLEEQLNDWRRELPIHLSLRAPQTLPPDNSDPNEKFRVILTLRYHNLRILLHRSILTKLLDLVGKNEGGNSEPLLTQFAPNNIRCAVESSLETVFIVSDIVSSGKQKQGMLGAWWFTLYYTFNSALVLCASYVIVQKLFTTFSGFSTPPANIMRDGIDTAIRTLSCLDVDNPTTNGCAKYLQKLSALVDFLVSPTHKFGYPTPGAIVGISSSHGLNDGDHSQNNGFSVNSVHTMFSPFGTGMDMGEFILDGDLEFLDRMTGPIDFENYPSQKPTSHQI